MTTKEVQTPRGVTVQMHARDDTSDLSTIGSTFRLWGHLVDEYKLADIHSEGLLIDVGAHIGSVCIAFLLDNPKARALAVEPLPENVAMLTRNAESAGVMDRLTIVNAAVGTRTIHYGFDDHRYIGNIGGSTSNTAIHAETITLSQMVEWCGPADVLKTDCEGGEWALLADAAVRQCALIIGEYHHRGAEPLHALLDATHVVTTSHEEASTGNFRAVRR